MMNSKYYKIGSKEILMPLDHALDRYQSTWKRYDVALGYISGFVFKKYPRSSFIDIGANVGDSAALVRNYSSVPILAIEGSPEFFPYLEHNSIEIQGIVCADCFVGPEDLISAKSIQHSVGTASIKKDISPESNLESEQIRVLPLSRILEDHQEFKQAKLLKIDTDGFDFPIIDASLDVISEQLPVLFFEYDITFKEDAHKDSIQTIKSLCDVGYRQFLIYDNYGNFLLNLSSDNLGQMSDLTSYLLSNRYTTGSIAVYYFDVCAFSECDIDICNAIRDYELSLTLKSREILSSSLESESQLVQYPILNTPLIVIDGVFFQLFKTGIARVWSSLLKEWSESEFARHIIVLDRKKSAPKIPGITYRDVRAYNYGDVDSDRMLLQTICDEENASLFISTYYTTPLTTASVFMTYDMIPEVMGWDLTHPMWQTKNYAINHASSYISISQNTAKDLASVFPEVVDYPNLVSCLAFDESVFKKSSQNDIIRFQEKYSISKPYWLLVGHPGGYKNGILFFQSLSKLADRSQFDVICTCSVTELDPELVSSVDGYKVHLLKLSDDDLRSAYSGAIALVYPSKYEGFGLPILEAMACSCPVITCAISSIPEVAGDAAIFVDPDDVDSMVNAIVQIQDSTVRRDLIEKGLINVQKFSWAKTAELMSGRLLETARMFHLQKIEDNAIIEQIASVIDVFDKSKITGDLGDLSGLRYARQILAHHYLSKSLDQLKVSHLGPIGDIHRELCNYQSLLGQLTDSETHLVSSLSEHFQSNSIGSLLSAVLVSMLYQRPDLVCRNIDITKIPFWFLKDYTKFICTLPLLFNQVGEISQYVGFMIDWLRFLNEKAINEPDSIRWNEVAWMTLQHLNMIPFFLVEQNIKEYFVIRASLVAYYLTSKNYSLQYQFPSLQRDGSRIRLGVLATHFTPQAETFASLPIYKSLDRNKFEIILISQLQTGHRLERYCMGLVDLDVKLPDGLTNRVTCIRNLDLDILFFATNTTLITDDMLLLASHRLARIQVTGMNSPTTTGLKSIDYYISGAFINPIFSVDDHYSETIVSLKSAGQCFDFATERSLEEGELISWRNFAISESSIVYCSGANFREITPELELSWVKIIAAIPDSVLMLYPFTFSLSDDYPIAVFRDRINQTFMNYGLDFSRLIILDSALTRSQIMNRLRIADIYLDSYPSSGMMLLVDPLILNMPTLVMEMNSARSLGRGSAFLRELKVEELIVRDVQSYIDLAIQLGQDTSFRNQMRDAIQLGMSQNPSFVNVDRYGEEISKAFYQIFDDYQSKQILNSFEMRDKNVIIFPDWDLDEDELFESMISPVRLVAADEACEKTSLLVYIGDRDPEEADLLMSSVLMYLVIEEGIEVSDIGPAVIFLDEEASSDLHQIKMQ
jgi:FkbM family methyltransferase